MRTLTILLATALLLSAAGAALAEDHGKGKPDDKGKDGARGDDHHGKPEFRPQGDRFLFHNDQIAVLFHENKNHAAPDVRVVFNGTADNESSGYRVKLLSLYEADRNDTNGDRHLPRINLARMDDWNVKTTEGNGTLTLTMVRAEAQGIVTLTWHLDTVDAKVKFDVGVDNWRWANASDVLILDMLVQGKNLKNETGAKVSVEDAGYVSWSDNASATYGNSTQSIPVSAFQGKPTGGDDERGAEDESEHEKAEDHSGKGGHIYLVFNGTGGYDKLSYDPELGVQESGASPVAAAPGFEAVLAVAAVFGVALLVVRRKP